VLNVSADHMDRYADIQAYQRAKLAVYQGAENIVINRSDPLTRPLLANHVKWWSFGLDAPHENAFGIVQQGTRALLAFEDQALMPLTELRLPGRHNVQNALAALAIGKAAGLPFDAMLEELRSFEGLPHRCEWVAEIGGVQFINDSKGTNVGATVAAIEGLGVPPGRRLVLIAGGQGKGADFSALRTSVQQHVHGAVLIGADAKLIDKEINSVTDTCFALDLPAAVQAACAMARPGDSVLFSPACASFDMYSGFEQRGQAFIQAVRAQGEA
ncbi:MAG: UDP-N-acetylmuramoyl-L-alanine--D-glutamate ligase, partial [Pseudomonadales bacterium]